MDTKESLWIYVAQTSQGVEKLLWRGVKRNENINMRSLGKAGRGVALPPRRALALFLFATVLDLFPRRLLAPLAASIFTSFEAFLCKTVRR